MLTTLRFCRLDDVVAFPASNIGKGEEARHQYCIVWIGIADG